MKYYSDELKEFFPTEEECLEAEKKHLKELDEKKKAQEKLSVERKARAKEVEDAMKAARDAQKKYNELLCKFVDDFGSFHFSISDKVDNSWFSLFDSFFKF